MMKSAPKAPPKSPPNLPFFTPVSSRWADARSTRGELVDYTKALIPNFDLIVKRKIERFSARWWERAAAEKGDEEGQEEVGFGDRERVVRHRRHRCLR